MQSFTKAGRLRGGEAAGVALPRLRGGARRALRVPLLRAPKDATMARPRGPNEKKTPARDFWVPPPRPALTDRPAPPPGGRPRTDTPANAADPSRRALKKKKTNVHCFFCAKKNTCHHRDT